MKEQIIESLKAFAAIVASRPGVFAAGMILGYLLGRLLG